MGARRMFWNQTHIAQRGFETHRQRIITGVPWGAPKPAPRLQKQRAEGAAGNGSIQPPDSRGPPSPPLVPAPRVHPIINPLI